MITKSLFYLAWIIFLFPLIAFAQQQGDYSEGEAIIKIANPFIQIETVNGIVSTEQSWFNSLASQFQISELKPIFDSPHSEFDKYYLVIFDSSHSVDEVVDAFEVEADVLFAEPNFIFQIFGSPNDPFFDLRWGLTKIQANLAWDIESGNASVIVGVVDTGTDLLRDNGNPHPDLTNNLWNVNGKYGYNVLMPGELPDDGNGHGTHVAGIIAAETDNGTGIAGLAGGGFGGDAGIQIMTVRAGFVNGLINASFAASGILWAADHGADIINMSFGKDSDPGHVIHDAIQFAYGQGVVLVGAVGNKHFDLDLQSLNVYPAEFQEVLAVAGTDVEDFLSPVSNFGSNIEVCAPAGESEYP